MLKFSISIILGMAVLASCSKNNKVTPVYYGSTPTYKSFVKNIMASSCVGCHSDMSTYSGLSNHSITRCVSFIDNRSLFAA